MCGDPDGDIGDLNGEMKNFQKFMICMIYRI